MVAGFGAKGLAVSENSCVRNYFGCARNYARYAEPVSTSEQQCEALRTNIQRFIRGFGLLSEERTPCGQPLPLSHAHALMLLASRDEGSAMCQRDLAVALGLDKSSVARLCARMERAGHVSQRRSPADGRAREVELTAKGQRLARQVETESRGRFTRVLAAIPPKQRGRVVDALEALNAALQTLQVSP